MHKLTSLQFNRLSKSNIPELDRAKQYIFFEKVAEVSYFAKSQGEGNFRYRPGNLHQEYFCFF